MLKKLLNEMKIEDIHKKLSNEDYCLLLIYRDWETDRKSVV